MHRVEWSFPAAYSPIKPPLDPVELLCGQTIRLCPLTPDGFVCLMSPPSVCANLYEVPDIGAHCPAKIAFDDERSQRVFRGVCKLRWRERTLLLLLVSRRSASGALTCCKWQPRGTGSPCRDASSRREVGAQQRHLGVAELADFAIGVELDPCAQLLCQCRADAVEGGEGRLCRGKSEGLVSYAHVMPPFFASLLPTVSRLLSGNCCPSRNIFDTWRRRRCS